MVGTCYDRKSEAISKFAVSLWHPQQRTVVLLPRKSCCLMLIILLALSSTYTYPHIYRLTKAVCDLFWWLRMHKGYSFVLHYYCHAQMVWRTPQHCMMMCRIAISSLWIDCHTYVSCSPFWSTSRDIETYLYFNWIFEWYQHVIQAKDLISFVISIGSRGIAWYQWGLRHIY